MSPFNFNQTVVTADLAWQNFVPLFYVPLALQAAAIAVDEFYFHLKRGLPKWERIGHPIDTLSVIASYVFLLLSPFDPIHVGIYIALSTISCALVTKDEFVHKAVCSSTENWLHAVLFILHPLSFIAAGFLWSNGNKFPFLTLQTFFIGLFLVYQITYWGLYGSRRSQ